MTYTKISVWVDHDDDTMPETVLRWIDGALDEAFASRPDWLDSYQIGIQQNVRSTLLLTNEMMKE